MNSVNNYRNRLLQGVKNLTDLEVNLTLLIRDREKRWEIHRANEVENMERELVIVVMVWSRISDTEYENSAA